MEQVKCLECKQKFNHDETVCPHCGWSVDKEALAKAKDKKEKIDSILLLLSFFGAVIAAFIVLSFIYPK